MMESDHRRFMEMALREAQSAFERRETPVGAVIVKDGSVIAKAHNQVEMLQDPTAHAEIVAMRRAALALANRSNGAPCSTCFASKPLEPNVNTGSMPVFAWNALPTSSNARARSAAAAMRTDFVAVDDRRPHPATTTSASTRIVTRRTDAA